MQRFILLATTLFAMFAQSSLSFASGGHSGGFNSGRDANIQTRQVDQVYETGKAIFNGRAKGEPSLQYCVAVGGQKIPVQRKSLKTFKKSSFNDFAKSLYLCDQPEKPVSESLTRDSLLYVVYYLDKRHKLDLRGS
ncbi:MAG: hypothetical protein JKX81_17510 [Arenicella sp.]|nr:hypothetical protein [Arenicella sp.]